MVPVAMRQIRLEEVAVAWVQVEQVVVLLSREAVAVEDLEVDLVLVENLVDLVEVVADQVEIARLPEVVLMHSPVVVLVVSTDQAYTGRLSWITY